MNTYHIWCNLKDSRQDVLWAGHVQRYLDFLKQKGTIESWNLQRRKFGFGPEALGEFHITINAQDLAQLDSAFNVVATREGHVEQLHAPVYSMVTDFKSALYRDFPDPQRNTQQ
jgi:hypothetical protein